MFHTKKPSNMNSAAGHDRAAAMCVQGDSGLVLTTDPKPRLRWTVELHERFVDAVTQLGGPDSTFLYIFYTSPTALYSAPRLLPYPLNISSGLCINMFLHYIHIYGGDPSIHPDCTSSLDFPSLIN